MLITVLCTFLLQGKSGDRVGFFPANFVQRVRPGERVWRVVQGASGSRERGHMAVRESQVPEYYRVHLFWSFCFHFSLYFFILGTVNSMWWQDFFHLSISCTCFTCRGLEPIPTHIEWEAGYILDRLPDQTIGTEIIFVSLFWRFT